jgi:hypothetical protein
LAAGSQWSRNSMRIAISRLSVQAKGSKNG